MGLAATIAARCSGLRSTAWRVAVLLAGVGLMACAPAWSQPAQPRGHWVATWAQAMTANVTAVGGSTAPLDHLRGWRAPRVHDVTLREALYTSIGSEVVRIRLSNYFGHAPLAIAAVRVALPGVSQKGFAIDPRLDRQVTFGGRDSVTIAPGATALSDPVQLRVPRLAKLFVSLYFAGSVRLADVHPMEHGPTAVAVRGDATTLASLEGRPNLTAKLGEGAASHLYVVDELDVLAPPATRGIVAFGDSITDGAYATAPRNTWPGVLAELADGSAPDRQVGVVNTAISGNELTVDQRGKPVYGVSGLQRFERDVLDRAGVTDVVVLLGTNDLNRGSDRAGYPTGASFGAITNAYRMLIDVAHEHGLKIYGGTIPPFAGFPDPGWYTVEKEATRERVNRWIRTSGAFDGVIDFSRALAGPYTPSPLAARQHPLPPGLSDTCRGDAGLHPNDRGYRVMGTLVYDQLFHQALSPRDGCTQRPPG